MRLSRTSILFAIMCLIWGLSWIPVKAGLSSIPPFLFAGTRMTVAGAILLVVLGLSKQAIGVAAAHWSRLMLASLLAISFCYGLLFWGMLFISSGEAAMLELSFTPVALLGFALLAGHERFSRRKAGAIGLGLAGIAILFGPEALDHSQAGSAALVGGAAVTSAAVVYAAGSVLMQPLLRVYQPVLIAAFTMLVGGVALLGYALCVEAGAWAALQGRWSLSAWAGWAFLVLFGSLGGYTCFMQVLKDWGASKAGSFAFVSPVIAVAAGYVVYGERVGAVAGCGMAVMLLAAWLALRSRTENAAR